MDIVYCLLMAVYLILAANSDQTHASTRKFLCGMSALTVLVAILHTIT